MLQKIIFKLRYSYLKKINSFFGNLLHQIAGLKVGKGTSLAPLHITWPHQVQIGNHCNIEQGVYFKYDGIWAPGPTIVIKNNVFIGSNAEFNITHGLVISDNCLIASGCRFVDHDHGYQQGELMRLQLGTGQSIFVGEDVWIGANVVVLKGVQIGNGAIVAAGAVLTKSVPAMEIWGGVPARKIGIR